SDPFSFEYFQATDLSVFMLADFAGDFSRLACLRDSDVMMREATAIFNAYLDENVRFAQAAMGQSYALLCESDPHERAGLVLSNFLSRSFFNNVSDTWADAELSSVAAFVANISARLVANQADLSVVPSCWYPYIARAMERAAIMSASYVPQLRGDQAARAQVSDNIHALRAKYADAADGDLGRVAPSDLGSGRGCINVMTLAGGSGLAENGRMIWREVTKTFPARLIEIDFGRGKTRKTSVATGNASAQSKRTVNVFAFNGDLIVDACTLNPLVCREDAYNIGFLLWETSRPPETYLNGVMMLDEIWVPATYLVDVFRELVPPHVEVINVGKHIDVRHNASYGLRDLFGIHPDAKTFLVIGDFGSSLPRKNIEAAVDAFQSANPDKSEAVLIIKIRKIDRTHWSNQNGLWERIERKIKGDDRIHILQGNLSTQDYWGLLNDIDCMMSLHRSEGFGYGIAHCHGLGKKTIVSDYSAVQDFCNAETSYLVPCEEVLVNPVDMNCREFIGYWGEADIHVAAAAISEVIAHERGPSAMGEAAKAQFEALYGGDRFRNIIRERLSRASGIGEPMPLDDDDEDEAWSALAVGQGG
ncbi:MAG: glycosyltransferase, partial [Pseudomonadota bacterium]